MEYYDRTLFELSIEIDGYNRRWEEQWRHTRKIYALLYNVNAQKGKGKKEIELLPLPSEAAEAAWQKKIEEIADAIKFEQSVKGK